MRVTIRDTTGSYSEEYYKGYYKAAGHCRAGTLDFRAQGSGGYFRGKGTNWTEALKAAVV